MALRDIADRIAKSGKAQKKTVTAGSHGVHLSARPAKVSPSLRAYCSQHS
jgi:hypothetical protein